MFNSPLKLTMVFVAVCVITTAATGALTIDWWTIDSGGAMRATGGQFELSGTIGQHDATTTVMTGSTFELTGGFWAGAPVCACLSDVNYDGERNGQDVQYFVDCLLGSGGNCACADVVTNGVVDLDDLTVFVGDLLAGDSCP